VAVEHYVVTCWNCLGDFDALNAVWCSDDSKNPTKLCPFCFRCFCEASELYKKEFWRRAPARLQDELATLNKSKDRLGDILIRMRRLTTQQLLDALMEQRNTGKRLGEILITRGLVKSEDLTAALRTQGINPLTDTLGQAYAASPVWERSSPEAIIEYILNLAARKGASDVQIEPREEEIGVKYRIDGFFFRVDPLPKSFQGGVHQKLFQTFHLDPARDRRPQKNRITVRLAQGDFDLAVQTLPTAHGVSSTIKLINRTTFLKELTSIGLEIEDRVRLMEELRNAFGLVLVTGPVFNGANTTAYSIMNFLVRSQRDVVSLEAPIHWPMEGARQVEVAVEGDGSRMEETLRSMMAVRPEVLMLSALPDRGTAELASQLASSVLVVAVLPAQTAAQAVTTMVQMGVPPQLVAASLSLVTCQRLVRQICRICREPAPPPAAQTLAAHGIPPEQAARLQFFRGKGCPTCNQVGYRGRRAIFEVLPGTAEIRAAVLAGQDVPALARLGAAAGMVGLRERCLALVRDGLTTFDEFTRLRL
jgi:type II secretory ATPase GspE/PulE/Tfp pilus assembly ATPase PilB-like protein